MLHTIQYHTPGGANLTTCKCKSAKSDNAMNALTLKRLKTMSAKSEHTAGNGLNLVHGKIVKIERYR